MSKWQEMQGRGESILERMSEDIRKWHDAEAARQSLKRYFEDNQEAGMYVDFNAADIIRERLKNGDFDISSIRSAMPQHVREYALDRFLTPLIEGVLKFNTGFEHGKRGIIKAVAEGVRVRTYNSFQIALSSRLDIDNPSLWRPVQADSVFEGGIVDIMSSPEVGGLAILRRRTGGSVALTNLVGMEAPRVELSVLAKHS